MQQPAQGGAHRISVHVFLFPSSSFSVWYWRLIGSEHDSHDSVSDLTGKRAKHSQSDNNAEKKKKQPIGCKALALVYCSTKKTSINQNWSKLVFSRETHVPSQLEIQLHFVFLSLLFLLFFFFKLFFISKDQALTLNDRTGLVSDLLFE